MLAPPTPGPRLSTPNQRMAQVMSCSQLRPAGTAGEWGVAFRCLAWLCLVGWGRSFPRPVWPSGKRFHCACAPPPPFPSHVRVHRQLQHRPRLNPSPCWALEQGPASHHQKNMGEPFVNTHAPKYGLLEKTKPKTPVGNTLRHSAKAALMREITVFTKGNFSSLTVAKES